MSFQDRASKAHLHYRTQGEGSSVSLNLLLPTDLHDDLSHFAAARDRHTPRALAIDYLREGIRADKTREDFFLRWAEGMRQVHVPEPLIALVTQEYWKARNLRFANEEIHDDLWSSDLP